MKAVKISFALLCYLIGFATIIYYMDFFTGFVVPKGINSGNPSSFMQAVLVDIGLIILFALQHTIMARTGFKDWFESKLPASLTRSFYILLTSVVLGLLIWLWQPIPLVIYDARGSLGGNFLLGLYYLGWAIGLLSSFEIDHFELFGVKQVIHPERKGIQILKTPFFYLIVRHPIYVGWLLIHWMTPVLTLGHLLFAVCITVYIYIALIFEESDLIRQFGKQYLNYMQTTPRLNPLLLPFKGNAKAMRAIKIVATIGVIVLIGNSIKFLNWVSTEMAMMKSEDPLIWKDEITRLTAQNSLKRSDTSAVLFVGSSSFRFWDRIDEDLAPIRVINNGFGGAKITDVLHFKEELIYAFHPEKIVFFLGSNDICGDVHDKSPKALITLYEKLAKAVHAKFPECEIYILPVTPTLARWEVWPQLKQVNKMIKTRANKADRVTFINCQDAFLNENGEPIWQYYKWDGTHLNHEGYRIWSKALKQVLLNNDNLANRTE